MNLHVVTTFSTGIPHGHEGQPLVFGNTMYVVTPFPNNLIAVDFTKPGGAVKWIYEPHPESAAVGIACCDVVNRGALYADGKIIYNLLDAHTVAVDAETGEEVWRTKSGRHQHAARPWPGAARRRTRSTSATPAARWACAGTWRRSTSTPARNLAGLQRRPGQPT